MTVEHEDELEGMQQAGARSAQFEHTLMIREQAPPIVLTT